MTGIFQECKGHLNMFDGQVAASSKPLCNMGLKLTSVKLVFTLFKVYEFSEW